MVAGTKLSQIALGGTYDPTTDFVVGVRNPNTTPFDYLFTMPGAIVGQPVAGGVNNEFLYVNNNGNLAQDQYATRDASNLLYATQIGGFTSAQYEYTNPNTSNTFKFAAKTPGAAGNSITLVFNGTDDVATVLNTWNTANPTNMVGETTGISLSEVFNAQTITLVGGGFTGLGVNSFNFGGTPPFPVGTGSGMVAQDTTHGVNVLNLVLVGNNDIGQYTSLSGISIDPTNTQALMLASSDGTQAQIYHFSSDNSTYQSLQLLGPQQATMAYSDGLNNTNAFRADATQTLVNTFNNFSVQDPANNQWLYIDVANHLAAAGDYSLAYNYTNTTWDDNAETITNRLNGVFSVTDQTGISPWIYVNVHLGAQQVVVGDYAVNYNATQAIVNDVGGFIRMQCNNAFSVQNPAGDISLSVDSTAQEYFIGAKGFNNNTYLDINDATKLITVTNVPTYANDAAATTAGLTTGQLYKTTTSGITALNILP